MWCSNCQLEHKENRCPLVASSSVEAIEGYQKHLERKFWEQAYCAVFSIDKDGFTAKACADMADQSLNAWLERWGKK